MERSGEFPGSLKFVILSPDPNIARLKDTVRSIGLSLGENNNVLCVVGQETNKAQLEEMNGVCPTVLGGETVTSLMNRGLKAEGEDGWRMFVMEGARICSGVVKRYSTWVRGYKDILFPISTVQNISGETVKVMANFEECGLNGMLIHSRLFREVGVFSENPIKVSKSFWAVGALECGAVFKAVLGVKII